jgi:hypothetical protein
MPITNNPIPSVVVTEEVKKVLEFKVLVVKQFLMEMVNQQTT